MLDQEIELLKLAQSGDQFAMDKILSGNKGLVTTIARKYYLLGGDMDDLIQEGMIGFFKAINTYDDSRNIDFKVYAIKLIEREILSAIRKANSSKNQIIKDMVSIEENENLSDDKYPENDVILQENFQELLTDINSHLSKFESDVVQFYLQGYTYTDIAGILKVEPKSIDNCLYRIKTKLKYLKEKK